jgi:uncharacterized oligopeptide transporter (OPT) family protein
VPHVVGWSMLLGAVLSWGVMWPLLTVRANQACVLAAICHMTANPWRLDKWCWSLF